MGVSIKLGGIGNGGNQSRKRRNDENLGPKVKLQRKSEDEFVGFASPIITQTVSNVCHFWSQGKFCRFGDKQCRFLHSWVEKGGLSLMRRFEVGGSYAANPPVVTGISHIPSLEGFSQKLITATRDGSLMISDAASGGDPSSSFSTTLGVQITCMASQAPWVFLGIPNAVMVWNAKTNAHLRLTAAAGPFGLVYSLTVRDGWLMAGYQDGSISTWRLPTLHNDLFQPTGCLKGHSLPVISLALGDKFLYSGSMDNTIRVWELETQLCVFTLTGHTSAVTSLVCWEQYLVSASLDSTIRVWGRDTTGLNLELVYTHTQPHGIITFEGYHDSSGKPVLLCSCNDNSLRMYDLPSFKERGRVFCKADIRTISACSEQGCIFTGDAAGELRVWKCPAETPKTSSKQ